MSAANTNHRLTIVMIDRAIFEVGSASASPAILSTARPGDRGNSIACQVMATRSGNQGHARAPSFTNRPGLFCNLNDGANDGQAKHSGIILELTGSCADRLFCPG